MVWKLDSIDKKLINLDINELDKKLFIFNIVWFLVWWKPIIYYEMTVFIIHLKFLFYSLQNSKKNGIILPNYKFLNKKGGKNLENKRTNINTWFWWTI